MDTLARAYAGTQRAYRLWEQSKNYATVMGALVVNLVLHISGFAGTWGLYAVLVYLLLLLLADAAHALLLRFGDPHRLATSRGACIAGGQPALHTHVPRLRDELRWPIGVWLVWWALTQFFYVAGIHYTVTWPLLPVLFLCVLVASVAPQTLATDLFALLFLLELALPSTDWMPQYESSWWRGTLRVFAFFVAVFLADFCVENHALAEQAVADVVEAELCTRAQLDDVGEHARLAAAYFCVTIERYELVRAAEHRRTRTIVALSAWILVVSKTMIVLFAVGLLVVHALLYWQRRLRAPLPPLPVVATQPPPLPTPVNDVEAGVGGGDDDDASETSADASSSSGDAAQPAAAALPPPPTRVYAPAPTPQRFSAVYPPAAAATRHTPAPPPGVRTKMITISRTQ